MGSSSSVFTTAHGQMPLTYLVTSQTTFQLGTLALLDQEKCELLHLGLHANEFLSEPIKENPIQPVGPPFSNAMVPEKKMKAETDMTPENKIKLSSQFEVAVTGEGKGELGLENQLKGGASVTFKASQKNAFAFVGDKVQEKPCHDKAGTADKLEKVADKILSQPRMATLKTKRLTLVVVVDVIECSSGTILWSKEEGLTVVASVDATVTTPVPLSQVLLSGKLNFDRQKSTMFEDSFSVRDKPYTCFVKVARIVGEPIKGSALAPGDPSIGSVNPTEKLGFAVLDS